MLFLHVASLSVCCCAGEAPFDHPHGAFDPYAGYYYLDRAGYRVPSQVGGNVQHTTYKCNMQRTSATCNIKDATYKMQHTSATNSNAKCNLQDATYGI